MATALYMPTARQAKRAGPKLEAGPEASAERSEGTMEARQGRDAAGGSMRYAHDSATGHLPGGRGRPHDFNEIPLDCYSPSHRHNGNDMDIRALQDDELMAQARDWRQRALRGEKNARGFAHELECEVRRRFPKNDRPLTLPPVRLLGTVSQPIQRRWKPW
jgi:hypothetical protein